MGVNDVFSVGMVRASLLYRSAMIETNRLPDLVCGCSPTISITISLGGPLGGNSCR